ncbi:MAG TPA: hypothetical protein GX708_05390 [Gallicola sp.]|nr:hypothetical protein [Gallicola sp.]
MELKSLISNMSGENITLDDSTIKIDSIITEGKYNILITFLNEKNIFTTNDLKKINVSDYNKLKMEIPNIDGVGEERTNLFIKKLDYVRKNKHEIKENITSKRDSEYPMVELLGKFKTTANWSIEINHILYNKYDEYVDIRQVKNDGTRGKGISIKRQDFDKFKEIISSINLDIITDEIESLESLLLESDEKSVESNDTLNLEKMFFENNEKKSLKEQILENEDKLYKVFKDDFGLAIKFFKAKIESLNEDGDIVKFLENPSILDIKKEQFDKTHSRGMKTAIDIKNDFDKRNLKYTTIDSLTLNQKVNTMTICSIANNFNVMLGMYYDNITKSLILKCQIKDGPYEDKWIEPNKKLYYCLQNETNENFSKLSFSKYPNTVCKNILFGYDLETKVYLFYRYNKNDDYTYAGEVKLEKFVDGNKAIIVNIG